MRTQAANGQHVLVKPLQNGSVAVTFFNKGTKAQAIQYNMKLVSEYIDIQNASVWNNASSYSYFEVWGQTTGTTTNTLVSDSIAAQDVRVYIVTPQK